VSFLVVHYMSKVSIKLKPPLFILKIFKMKNREVHIWSFWKATFYSSIFFQSINLFMKHVVYFIMKSSLCCTHAKCFYDKNVIKYKKNILIDLSQYSIITDHILKSNHDFDWENVEILDQELSYYKRLISEMCFT